MKHSVSGIQRSAIILFLSFITIPSFAQSGFRLWYKKPAATWVEALPVGNGRMAAMVFGRTGAETIQLNEESLWAGHPIDENNPQSAPHLKEIRQLLLDGKNNEAHELITKYMVATPRSVRSYQTLGKIVLQQPGTNSYIAYERSLDISTGVAKTVYTVGNVNFQRDVFVSAPEDVTVVRCSSSAPGKLGFTLNLLRERDASVKVVDNHTLLLSGKIIDTASEKSGEGGEGVKFNAIVRLINEGGIVASSDGGLVLKNANSATILVTAATDYELSTLNFNRQINPQSICEKIISKAAGFTYDQLLQHHLHEFKPQMARVAISLGDTSRRTLPTDERLAKLKAGDTDNDLVALYFQYGRYLLLSSSRKPGHLPANLQGKWNESFDAPWNSDYHTNINLQMNYWPAQVTNLTETFEPFTDFVDSYRIPGRRTAKEMYGARGWTMHHCTDIFGRTGINDGVWGASPMAAAWLCMNIWEQYAFTKDENFLKQKAWPILKEAAEFVQDFLVKDKHGYLVTAPSTSPENTFFLPDGTKDHITYAPAIDVMIIRNLYQSCIQATEILHTDKAFAAQLKKTLAQLPPIKISPATGGIQEWIEDYKEVEPGHRHISHLVGLYPGNLITADNKALFAAAGKTLERRLQNGGGHTGWSRAWIINFYARLLDGDKAYENVIALLKKSTLNNLFDTHPPFQIDGNFGGTAGIAEMLLQSHAGYIRLLPALPEAWRNGMVSGLLARGAYEISMNWQSGKLLGATVKSKKGGVCKLKYGTKTAVYKMTRGEIKTITF